MQKINNQITEESCQSLLSTVNSGLEFILEKRYAHNLYSIEYYIKKYLGHSDLLYLFLLLIRFKNIIDINYVKLSQPL